MSQNVIVPADDLREVVSVMQCLMRLPGEDILAKVGLLDREFPALKRLAVICAAVEAAEKAAEITGSYFILQPQYPGTPQKRK